MTRTTAQTLARLAARIKERAARMDEGFEVIAGGLIVFVDLEPQPGHNRPHILSVWDHRGRDRPGLRDALQVMAEEGPAK